MMSVTYRCCSRRANSADIGTRHCADDSDLVTAESNRSGSVVLRTDEVSEGQIVGEFCSLEMCLLVMKRKRRSESTKSSC